MYRIMLVDDEESIVKALRRTLADLTLTDVHGELVEHAIEVFTSPQKALERASYSAFDLVISDYRMPGMDGVDFLKALKAYQPNIARLILSGYADLDGLVRAINDAEIYRFIVKPWHDFELIKAVSQALSFRALQLENERLADIVREQRGQLSKHEIALKELEQQYPGITKVSWGADGSVLLDEDG